MYVYNFIEHVSIVQYLHNYVHVAGYHGIINSCFYCCTSTYIATYVTGFVKSIQIAQELKSISLLNNRAQLLHYPEMPNT